RLQLALTWGQQAVLVAESFIGDGSAQKATAMNDLQKRLAANGLSKYFSAQQLDAIIQQGYATVKQSGLLKQVAPTISASSDPQPNVEKPVMDKVTTPTVKAVVPDMRKPQGGTNA
ncbi:hypothetical protein, partial [Furfurilactobacillus entadae]|uniref:hypothetical protein n=1 Tax=Furfurilactobacillus entadae TaxID=2922307 RepID=UPI0038B30363